jgi:hypothetical protein
MNTNFQMLRELLTKYHPKERGIVSAEEAKLIKETLHIAEMNVLALRNLRDFTVLFLGESEKMEDWDRMSAITYIIDSEIIQKGGEV